MLTASGDLADSLVESDGSGNITANVTGNADTATLAADATTLATPRNFSITGDITAGAVSFDGSGNVSLNASIDANTVGSSELNTTIASSGTENFPVSGGNVYWTPSAGIYNVMRVSGGINFEIRVSGTWRSESGIGAVMLMADGSNMRFFTNGIATASLVWQKF